MIDFYLFIYEVLVREMEENEPTARNHMVVQRLFVGICKVCKLNKKNEGIEWSRLDVEVVPLEFRLKG